MEQPQSVSQRRVDNDVGNIGVIETGLLPPTTTSDKGSSVDGGSRARAITNELKSDNAIP